MSPRQVAIAYGALCLLTFSIASVFAVRGMWLVLVYAVLETFALAIALLHYARHATDLEHIALSEGCLLIERFDAGDCVQVLLDPAWAQVRLPTRRHALIRIESRGVKLEVGGFVSEQTRMQVAEQLRAELRAAAQLAWR